MTAPRHSILDRSSSTLMIIASLALFSLIPVWLFDYFPSLDGPIHMYIPHLLERYAAPDGDHIRHYFEINPHLEPNEAVYLVIRMLELLFSPPVTEKIVVSLIGLALAGAACYAVTVEDRAALPLAVAILPLMFSIYVHRGSYNFSLSIVGFLIALGYWLRHAQSPRPVDFVILACLSLALVYTHLFGFVILAFVVGAMSLVTWPLARRGTAGVAPLSWRSIAGRFLGLAGALLPAAIVFVDFSTRYPMETRPGHDAALLPLLARAASMTFLASYDWWELAIFLPVLGAAALLVPSALRTTRARANAVGLLVALVALIGVYLFGAATVRGIIIGERLQPFILLLGLLWLASCHVEDPQRRYRLIVLAAVLAVVVGTGHRTWRYRMLNDYLAEYLSVASAIAPRRTLLSINLAVGQLPPDSKERLRHDPLRHAGARIALLCDGVYLNASLLSPNLYGYFPIRYRNALDPFVHIGPSIASARIEASEMDLLGFDHGAAGRVDYVLLWPVTEAIQATSSYRDIAAQLEPTHERIYVSEQRGLAHLYRRRDLGPAL